MKFAINLNVKKTLQKLLVFGLPLAVTVAAVSVYTINNRRHNSSKPISSSIVISPETMTYRQVYLLSKDEIVVPLTVGYEAKDDVIDEITYVTSLLSGTASLLGKDYLPVLASDIKLNEAVLEDSILTLNFDEKFASYDARVEHRILEALAWTYAQFDEVETLKLQVDGEELTNMPVNNLPIPATVNKAIGINNHLFNVGATNVDTIVVYYQAKYNQVNRYIPVSVNVSKTGTKIDKIHRAIESVIPVASLVKKADALANNDIIEIANLDEESNVDISLGVSSLIDEVTVNSEIYEFIVLNLLANDVNAASVSVIVNEEKVSVNGYENSSVAVSNLVYNSVKI